MDRHRVAIVIPAFNEGVTIYDEVQSLKKYGVVIVVNDGSTDHTEVEALSAGATVVNHRTNKGYDKALNSGLLKASKLGCKIFITFDADGQHDPYMVKKIIMLIESGSDVVIGVRNKFQRISEHIFSWVSRYKWGIKDPLCGLKGYNLNVYEKIGYFSSYNSIGTELCISSFKLGLKISQIPINISDRADNSRIGNNAYANIKILWSLLNAMTIKSKLL